MDLRNKNTYIPGFVPGENKDEVLENVFKVVDEIASPRDKHILQYCKRARTRKKYMDKLIREAVSIIFLRQISEAIAKSEREG